MLRNWIERAVNRSWYGGVGWTFLFLPLIPAVHLFVWARRRYRQSVPFASLGAPVVIVGGLTAGGTGKTPVIIALARELGNRGINVGIVGDGGTDIGRGKAADRLIQTVKHVMHRRANRNH